MPDIGTLAARVTLDSSGFVSGAKRVEDELKRIKKRFGEESLFGAAGKALVGGGIVAGVTLVGKALEDAGKRWAAAGAQFKLGQIGVAGLIGELVDGIPIVGQFARTAKALGDAMAIALTGENSITRAAKAASIAEGAAQIKAGREARLKETGDLLDSLQKRSAFAGLSGAGKEFAELRFEKEQMRLNVEAFIRKREAADMYYDPTFVQGEYQRARGAINAEQSAIVTKWLGGLGSAAGGIGSSVGRMFTKAGSFVWQGLVTEANRAKDIRARGAIDRALSDAESGFGSLRLAEAGIDETSALFKARQTAARLAAMEPGGAAAVAAGLLTSSSAAAGFGERFGAMTGAAPETQNKILNANEEQVKLQRELVRQGRGGVVWTR